MNVIDTCDLTDYFKAVGPDYHVSDNQRICGQLVEREVYCCVSELVSDLLTLAGESAYGTLRQTSIDYDELVELCRVKGDAKEAAEQECWYKFSELGEDERHRVMAGFEAQAAQDDEDFDPDYEPVFVRIPLKAKGQFTQLEESYAEDWQELCGEQGINIEDSEVYEHWVVSSWFKRKLYEHGETTGEISGLDIWGRSCTGQAIKLDHVIWEIAAEMQILVGQKNDWSKQ